MRRGQSAAGRFAPLNRWEADLVERRLAIPAGPPPAPLLRISVLANGSKLWFAIAAAMALRPGLRRAAYEGVVAVLLATGTTQILNRLVDRPRPPADSPARRALPHQPTAPSFPSSHTAAATAFTTAVARHHPRVAAALAPLAGTLAYGRIRLRAHWPTDVLGGRPSVPGRSPRPVCGYGDRPAPPTLTGRLGGATPGSARRPASPR